jgi:hypothetical protein
VSDPTQATSTETRGPNDPVTALEDPYLRRALSGFVHVRRYAKFYGVAAVWLLAMALLPVTEPVREQFGGRAGFSAEAGEAFGDEGGSSAFDDDLDSASGATGSDLGDADFGPAPSDGGLQRAAGAMGADGGGGGAGWSASGDSGFDSDGSFGSDSGSGTGSGDGGAEEAPDEGAGAECPPDEQLPTPVIGPIVDGLRVLGDSLPGAPVAPAEPVGDAAGCTAAPSSAELWVRAWHLSLR